MESPSNARLLLDDIEGLLDFFDEKPDCSVGHATGIVSLAGEDLNAACLRHYLKAMGGDAVVLRDPVSGRPCPVTTGRRKGPRLDRWVRVEWPGQPEVVFQTEIKSWSAHGFGGVRLPLGGSASEVRKRKRDQWDALYDSRRRQLKHPMTLKVLERMKPPKDVDPGAVRPMLIFWFALESRKSPNAPLFRVEVRSPEFDELWVFSVSGYLRSLRSQGVERIELDMPDAALRLRKLNGWFSSV